MFLFYCRNLLVWHVFAPYIVFIQRLLITKIMSKLKKKKKVSISLLYLPQINNDYVYV